MLLFISINTVMSKNVARQNQSVQLHGVLVETSAYKMMCDASSSPDILIRPSFWLSPAASRLIPGGCSLKHLRKNILYSSGAVLWAAKRCNSLTPPPHPRSDYVQDRLLRNVLSVSSRFQFFSRICQKNKTFITS